jgi:hypothetical protein
MSRRAGLSWPMPPTGMRSVRPGRYFWRAVFRTGEHEIALLDAGREELAGIFPGHPVRVDRITTTFSILDYSDVRRGQEGLEVESLLPDFGVPTHCFINNSGENTQ